MTAAITRAVSKSIRKRTPPAARGSRRYDRSNYARPGMWEQGEFVAIDGEGFSDGPEFTRIVGSKQSLYKGREHYYAYLADSDGHSIYSDAGRLTLGACLSFLCQIFIENPRAIIVAFGGSYDVCHMVAFDLDRDQVRRLLGQGQKPQKLIVDIGEWTYALEYRPRKCFTIQRWPYGARRWTLDGKGNKKATPHLTVRIWDVWGFFQDSFVGVLSKWIPGDPDYEFIRRMKGDRNIFERTEIEEIKRYNAAELRCLVKVMNRVRDAINDLGLKITRWDGAGAIAAAMLAHWNVKEHKREPPSEVFDAARRAYSGGHIEACKIGYHWGAVHHYDINSAYPDQFRRLPSLSNGRWAMGVDDPPGGFTLVNVEWTFPEGLPFYPLFYRCGDGSIIYPSSGSGWYWFPEYEVARDYSSRHGSHGLKVKRWHSFISEVSACPFEWVEDYYSQRRDYINAAKRGGYTSGPEKIIKLGLNSLYGKTAQQVGARYDAAGKLRLPPYFQLEWAGYVTSGCRAKLMDAALQKPQAIIAFATDGLFSTEPLDLDCPDEKTLGAWEYVRHDGITVVMPGVYWLHDGDSVKHYSRGFDKREMSDAQFVHVAWARRADSTPIKLTRLIGLGSAAMSADFWEMRGCFVESTRYLCLDGDNSKRYAINLNRDRPHLGLVDTMPRDHFLPNIFEVPESAPYPIAWLDGEVSRDLLEGELADELEAMDAELA